MLSIHCLALSVVICGEAEDKASFLAHDRPIQALVLSPCGKFAACANLGYGEIHVWSIATGKRDYTLGLKHGGIASLSFSPDGKYIASCGHQEPTRIWDLKEKRVHKKLVDGVLGAVRVSFSPDGGTLVTGEHDLRLNFWDSKTGRLAGWLPSMEPIRDLAFSPDGKTLAVGGAGGGLQLWDVKKERLIAHVPGHKGPLSTIAFHPKEPILLTGGADGDMVVWDLDKVKISRRFKIQPQVGMHVYALTFLPDGSRAAAGGTNARGYIFDLAGKADPVLFADHGDRVYRIAISPDGKSLVTGSWDCHCKVWDVPK